MATGAGHVWEGCEQLRRGGGKKTLEPDPAADDGAPCRRGEYFLFHLTYGLGSDGGERRTFLGGARCDYPGCFDPWLSCVFRARARALEQGLISNPFLQTSN